MARHVADNVTKLMLSNKISVVGSKILVMGLTFKENCPDLRNSKIIDLIDELKSYHAEVHVHDPWVDPIEVKSVYGLNLTDIKGTTDLYDAIIVALSHREFIELGARSIRQLGKPGAILYDLKSIFDISESEGRL